MAAVKELSAALQADGKLMAFAQNIADTGVHLVDVLHAVGWLQNNEGIIPKALRELARPPDKKRPQDIAAKRAQREAEALTLLWNETPLLATYFTDPKSSGQFLPTKTAESDLNPYAISRRLRGLLQVTDAIAAAAGTTRPPLNINVNTEQYGRLSLRELATRTKQTEMAELVELAEQT